MRSVLIKESIEQRNYGNLCKYFHDRVLGSKINRKRGRGIDRMDFRCQQAASLIMVAGRIKIANQAARELLFKLSLRSDKSGARVAGT